MHFYTMTIIEETESEYRSELKLWENTHGQIWLEIGYGDNDPCTTQGIPLTKDDAQALIAELSRLMKGLPSADDKGCITPAQPLPSKDTTGNPGQLPLSKVNWHK